MNLPQGITETKYYELSYKTLEKLVKQYLGRDYCFTADQESGNDSSHTFVVDLSTYDEDEQAEVQEWIKDDDGNYMASLLLNELCLRDVIPEGDYIVGVCW